MNQLIEIDKVKEFGGWLTRYTHRSSSNNCEMTFSVYLPPLAEKEEVPVLYWLSGLTCTDENFRTKAGAQRYAAELGLALIIPDTSPRGEGVADQSDRYDMGKGAGFYVNATESPWAAHYQMYSYITDELPALIEANFPVKKGVASIAGHSMGGHGALICALKNSEKYKSVSAFSPICNPSVCQWGQDAFTAYLGTDKSKWAEYDSTELIKKSAQKLPILIDQGLDDNFLEAQLFPQNIDAAAKEHNWDVQIRMHRGYDHSFYFIASFIGEHLNFHSKYLK